MSKLFISIFLILLVLPLASASNPHTSSSLTSNGLIISSMFPDHIRQNNNYTFFWYVQNQSNSAFMNNTAGISCQFELYKMTGFNGLHVVTANGIFDGVEEWSSFIDAGNFSLIGDYIERIKCNSTIDIGIGGIADNQLKVTATGSDYSSFDFTPIIMAFIAAIAILVFLSWLLAENHGIVPAVFAGLAFYMLVPLINIAALVFQNNFSNPGISGMIGSVTTILTWLDYALIIYIVIYILINIIKNYEQKKQEELEGLR